MQDRPGLCNNAGPSRFPTARADARRPCTQRPTRGRARSPSTRASRIARRREYARQARGESRAHEPRDHALTRRTPRLLRDATSAGPDTRMQQCRTVPVHATMQDRPGLCNNAGPSRFLTARARRVRRWPLLSRPCVDATGPTTSAALRREPDGYVASLSPRTCRALRAALEEACEHATLGASQRFVARSAGKLIAHNRIVSNDVRCRRTTRPRRRPP
jgi:hypothetical protein